MLLLYVDQNIVTNQPLTINHQQSSANGGWTLGGLEGGLYLGVGVPAVAWDWRERRERERKREKG